MYSRFCACLGLLLAIACFAQAETEPASNSAMLMLNEQLAMQQKTPGDYWDETQDIHVIIIAPRDRTFSVIGEGTRAGKAEVRVAGTPAIDSPTQQMQGVIPGITSNVKVYDYNLGRFAGGTTLTIKVADGEGAAPADHTAVGTQYIETVYSYGLEVGVIGSDLGDKRLTRAPGADETTVLGQYDSGATVQTVFGVSIFPNGPRVLNCAPRDPKDRWSVTLGTTFNDPLKTIVAGVGYEIAPCSRIVIGGISGEVARPAPGYALGDVVPATGELPTVDKRSTKLFAGVFFSTELWGKLFKSSGK